MMMVREDVICDVHGNHYHLEYYVVVSVSFTADSYTVGEEELTLDVCLSLNGSTEVPVSVILSLQEDGQVPIAIRASCKLHNCSVLSSEMSYMHTCFVQLEWILLLLRIQK